MSNYFLGSVGVAEAFSIKEKRLVFVARTLTEHSINISATQDELRGGTGSSVQTTFTHDPNIEIKLVDVLWNSTYIETILGKKFRGAGQVTDYISETLISSGPNTLTYLSHTPVSLPFGTYVPNEDSRLTVTLSFPLGGVETKIMINQVGTDTWTWYTGLMRGNGIYLPAGSWNVYYMAEEEGARELWVDSDLCPQELYLIITAPLYKADGCEGNLLNNDMYEVGHLTFEIPRFKVKSELNLGFQMSSQTSLEISGIALATEDCCGDTLKMMRIVEVRDDYDFTDEIEAITISGE